MNTKFRPESKGDKDVQTQNVLYTNSGIARAIEEKTIISSLVTSCSDDMTLELSIGPDVKGYIKLENLEYNFHGGETKAIAALSKVGRHVQYVPQSITSDGHGGYLVDCSRKEAQKQCYDEFISKLKPGDIIDAHIVRIEDYGIFCDVGCGIISLLPTSLISITHVTKPKKLLDGITDLKVVVKGFQEDGRLQLSHRELLGTWKQEVSKITAGSTICGTVLSIEPYGVFIRLSQNLSGLASSTKLDIHPGDIVSVHINSIVEQTMKIKLNIVNKIDGAEENLRFNYYIDEGHIDKWVYSDTPKKKIVTDFTQLEQESEAKD